MVELLPFVINEGIDHAQKGAPMKTAGNKGEAWIAYGKLAGC
ncbi:hypothetical protein ACFXGI_05710 [Streptomyces sp. NPDC059355]